MSVAMVALPRIVALILVLPVMAAMIALWPQPAAAQFWAPWFSRGYQPPPNRGYQPPQQRRRGGTYDTLLPWQRRPQPEKPRRVPKKEPAPEAAPQPVEEGPVPYQPEFARLAELLGALHYLAPLCGEKQGDPWRGEMEELLAAEQPSPKRKEALIASFNRGFQSYELSYRHCTPSATLAIGRSKAEGARLAHEIATRYGN